MMKLTTVLCYVVLLEAGIAEEPSKGNLSSRVTFDAEVARLVASDDFKQNERNSLLAIGTNAIETLVTYLRTSQGSTRDVRRAVGMLEFVSDSCAVSVGQETTILAVLQIHLESANHYVRQAAVTCLSKLKLVSVVPSILPLLEDEDEFTRIAAARALAVRGDRATVRKIEEILKRRSTGLSSEEIAKDHSFKVAQQATIAILDREKDTNKGQK